MLLDHTYVTCGTGHCWPCWGDCECGAIITTGTGSSAQAQCLSEPDGGAGIYYGVTGLCHQTANRILWPAGITVSEAIGYFATEQAFCTYGTEASGWIAHRDACIGHTGEIAQCTGEEDPERNPSSSWVDAVLSFIIGWYEGLSGEEGPGGEEEVGGAYARGEAPLPNLELLANVLELRVKHVLRDRASPKKVEALQSIQREVVSEKIPLDQSLFRRELSGREFADRVNGLINRGLLRATDAIDEADYVALYKLRPGAKITVVRPDVCELVYG
jgi:hypothetical protein